MTYASFIEQTLSQSAEIARDSLGKVSSTTKIGDNNQVLTETDIAIGKVIIQEIHRYYPSYNIIDEEAGVIDNNSHLTWVVDPIDGTSNFANGIPSYGVMIGLLEGDVPIAGGIALPSLSEIIIAEKGTGSFSNGQRIAVTIEENLSSCLIAYGIDGHKESPELTYEECRVMADIVLNIRNLRNSGSASDFAFVAKGQYGGILNKTSKIWDTVAPHIIIEEAGGIFTDYYGSALDYTNPLSRIEQNYTFCGAPKQLHEKLTAIINNKDNSASSLTI